MRLSDIWPELCMGQYRDIDYRKDAPHFTRNCIGQNNHFLVHFEAMKVKTYSDTATQIIFNLDMNKCSFDDF